MTHVWAQAAGVAQRTCTGATVVMRVDGDEPVTLDGTADALWKLLARPRAVRDLVEALAAEFSAPAELIERDVTTALERLHAVGLVDPVDQ